MKHFIIWYYFLCFTVGAGSILVYTISYLKYRISILRYYVIFLILFTCYLLINLISIYNVTIMNNTETHIYLILADAFFIWFTLFLYFMPAFFHFISERPFTKAKQIFFSILAAANLILFCLPYLIKKDPLSIYTMLKFELNVIDNWVFIAILIYLIIFMAVHYRKIENQMTRDILKKIFILTLVFFPGFLADLFYKKIQFEWKILPPGFNFEYLYYLIWNCISLFWAIKFFLAKFEISSKPVSVPFIRKFSITDRELEVLSLLIQGNSYQEICGKLFISMNTVRTHIYNIYQKTGINSKTELKQLVQSHF